MSMADILKKAKEKAAKSGGGNRMRAVKPAEGKSYWRILPGWNPKEPDVFYHAHGQHFIKDASGKIKAVVGCADKTYDHDCEICEMINAAVDALPAGTSDKEKEKITSARAGQRFLVNAVNRKDGAVVVLELGVGLFTNLIETLGEYDTLLDPEEGQDVVIVREGKGLDTKYTLTVRPAKNSPSVQQSELMAMHDLDAFVKESDEKSLQRAMKALGDVYASKGLPSTSAGALTGPKSSGPKGSVDFEDLSDVDDDAVAERARELSGSALDDSEIEDAEIISDEDLSELDDEEVEEPSKVEAKSEKSSSALDEELGEMDDDELEKMLNELD